MLSPQSATLSEIFAERVTDASAAAFALAHVPEGKTVLWVQDRLTRRECGRPLLAGLPVAVSLLYVCVSRPADVLWAMEEGLRCTSLGAVMGEVWGNPAALNFTATKRLALRSEAKAVPVWLMRYAGNANLSAARNRWRLGALPSTGNPDDVRAPGMPQWRADLFRARWQTPRSWVARYEAKRLLLEQEVETTTTAPVRATIH